MGAKQRYTYILGNKRLVERRSSFKGEAAPKMVKMLKSAGEMMITVGGFFFLYGVSSTWMIPH